MPDAGDIKIAAAYIRVSTEEQTEYSPDAQLVEIRKYASSRGFIIPNEFIFMDEGISGKNTGKRPAFNSMIGTAKQKPKPFDAILLWKFSRFARNREDSIVYKSMLRRQLGIEVLSVSEPLADDKMSIIMEAMIEAMDEYYSINLAEEVKRGMTEKARRGGLQSNPSFGYGVKDNTLTVVDAEADIIRAVFSRFISGEGLFPIAKWLNGMGIKTHRGSKFENRTIEYILRNPVYIGKMRWNPSGKTHRDFTNENIILADSTHEPIISQETWDATQRRMVEVKAQWKYHGRPASEYKGWVSGLVRCASCGATLVFEKPHYWKCNGYARGSCLTSQHVSDEKLKGMIMTCMERDMHSEAKISYAVAHSKPELLDEESILVEQKKQMNVKLSRLRDAYLSGVEDLDSYASAKAAMEATAIELDVRIKQLRTPKDEKMADTFVRNSIKNSISVLKDENADANTKRNAVGNIVERCTYSKEKNLILITYRVF